MKHSWQIISFVYIKAISKHSITTWYYGEPFEIIYKIPNVSSVKPYEKQDKIYIILLVRI